MIVVFAKNYIGFLALIVCVLSVVAFWKPRLFIQSILAILKNDLGFIFALTLRMLLILASSILGFQHSLKWFWLCLAVITAIAVLGMLSKGKQGVISLTEAFFSFNKYYFRFCMILSLLFGFLLMYLIYL